MRREIGRGGLSLCDFFFRFDLLIMIFVENDCCLIRGVFG